MPLIFLIGFPFLRISHFRKHLQDRRSSSSHYLVKTMDKNSLNFFLGCFLFNQPDIVLKLGGQSILGWIMYIFCARSEFTVSLVYPYVMVQIIFMSFSNLSEAQMSQFSLEFKWLKKDKVDVSKFGQCWLSLNLDVSFWKKFASGNFSTRCPGWNLTTFCPTRRCRHTFLLRQFPPLASKVLEKRTY